jgi:transposase-like protein
MATIPTQHHDLFDLTCPNCQKMNLVAVVSVSGNDYSEHAVDCAHCKKTWQALLPGPVMAGPFPK